MTDKSADTPVDLTAPLMPTGYGVADLEIAREQDALEQAGSADVAQAPMDDAAGGPTTDTEQMDEPSEEEAAAQLGDFA